ncbi:Alpha/Beta hydrolase protein [Echria macrotheca]|uniref:Alpha/Beta hydrolase protein n=1 Tax=Echria macrotheca TaxID=438768 RepID=A0AAJ0FBE6_9PEZI|nr:Alpha/Beta hydrolase protein [Echria macrotheca]
MPQPRPPTAADFSTLPPDLQIALIPPSPSPDSPATPTVNAILLLFHGLGDTESSFAQFARNLNLPGVFAISVRGVNSIPASLITDSFSSSSPRGYFHWGDDLETSLSGNGGEYFTKARDMVLNNLVRDVLIAKCGWATRDILLFGFGQGGSFALGLASWVSSGRFEVGGGEDGDVFRGVVAVGGRVPDSMIVGGTGNKKARTPVLVCRGRRSEVVDEEAVEVLREVFEDVQVVEWKRDEDGMPREREEVVPLMRFFADRLRAW